MNKILPFLLLFIFINSCSDDDDTPNCQGIDCLPEATQTGAGTFGCLVNGEPFYAFGGVNAQYQLINGEYFFVIGFARGAGFPRTILIESTERQIDLGLNNLSNGVAGNVYGFVGFEPFINATTDLNYNGVLNISRLDQQNQIVSGTFEFEILNPDDGQVYQITEGRFDSFYAQ